MTLSRFGFQAAALTACLSLLAVGCGDDGTTAMTPPDGGDKPDSCEGLAQGQSTRPDCPDTYVAPEPPAPVMTSLLQTSLGTELLTNDGSKAGVVQAIREVFNTRHRTMMYQGGKQYSATGRTIDRQTLFFTDTGDKAFPSGDDAYNWSDVKMRFFLADVKTKNKKVDYQLDFADLSYRSDGPGPTATGPRPFTGVFRPDDGGVADSRDYINDYTDFSVMNDSMKENKMKPDNFGFPDKYTTAILQAPINTDDDTDDDATVYAHVFTDYKVSGDTSNNNYAAGGVWLIMPNDRAAVDSYEAGASVTVGDGFKSLAVKNTWTGKVTYEGHALGFYSHIDEDGSNPDIKSLTAQVNLTADFLDATEIGTISGKLYNVALDGKEQETVLLKLPEVALYDGSTLSAPWNDFAFTSGHQQSFGTLGEETYKGTWAGMFRGKRTSGVAVPATGDITNIANIAGIIKLQGVDNKNKAIIAAFNAEKE